MGVSKAYLVAYNVLQCLGWAYLLVRMGPYLKTWIPGHRLPQDLYSQLGLHVRLFQTAAMLEVLHAMVGLVRSNPVITAVQIMSRLGVLWVTIHNVTASQTSPGLLMLLFAWTVTEIIRYAYYTVNLFGITVGILTWLRYTLFIVLYPLGVAGELWCYYDSLATVANSKMFSTEMPNKWNATFSFYVFTILVMVAYIPGFPKMYLHMVAQRKKIIGGNGDKKKAQ